MNRTIGALLDTGSQRVRGLDTDEVPFASAASAARLLASGLSTEGPAARVAVLLPQGPDLAGAIVGVMAAGVAVPLNPRLTADELRFTMHDAGVDALLTDPTWAGASEAIRVATDHGLRVFALDAPTKAHRQQHTDPDPDSIALLLHTSGTTARPKLVPLSHANLLASAAAVSRAMALTADDHGMCVMPLFHIHGIVGSLLSSLTAGATVTVAPFDALRLQSHLALGRHTWMSAVPTMYQALLLRPPLDGRLALRRVRSSSSTLPPSVWTAIEDRFECPVVNSYGMTEAAHQMSSTGQGTDAAEFATVGRAAGPDLAVLTPEGVVPRGSGELVVRGPSITSGYLSPSDANEGAFVDGWFRTGDTGAVDLDGRVVLHGRLKELINVGGEKVSPFEVDNALLSHPSVVEAVAFAVPSRLLGEEVQAVVTVRADVDEAHLRAHAREHLAKFKVPTRIHLVEEIPKGPTGKVQRIRLADQLGVTAQRDAAGTQGSTST
jgi:acyl-CoA synthetase (AMP-forming)/AMP-acid ligase II